MGKPKIPEAVRRKIISLSLSPDIIKRTKKFCYENNVTFSRFIEDALDFYIKDLESIPVGRNFTKEEIDSQVQRFRKYLMELNTEGEIA